MSKFRKNPIVVDASRWFKNGDHPMDYSKDHDGFENGKIRKFNGQERKEKGWEGNVVRYFRHPWVDGTRKCERCSFVMNDHGWIDTSEGGHTVCPGDWIITGIHGEYYPCKPDIFAATYVEEDHAVTIDDAIKWLIDCSRRAMPFLMDEASKYDDDGSNEPLETVRDIDKAINELCAITKEHN